MSGNAEEYARALREATIIIERMDEKVRWIDDAIGCDPSQLAIKWRFESRAEAEAFRDRMVDEFHPTRIDTVQPSTWGCITMDIPALPAVNVEITFYERPKE